ncbi:MAG: acireductone synthase [Planctomycetes bacterium]|nr:acireductone synthase [Planctomycetota bacterium]
MAIHFSGRGVLLDIEGTTSSISFVYDVMFPFVRRELEAHLRRDWGSPELNAACDAIARDAGHASFAAWAGDRPPEEQRRLVQREVLRLMDADAKTTGLKRLQGMIWESGFESGELKAHVYDDVPPALERWKAAGLDVRIYSSGSIQAQKLFFGHTTHGDLLAHFRGHYDTTTGPKKEATSYRTIAEEMRLSPGRILFLSDAAAELEAARLAGMHTALARRPGNPEPPSGHDHEEIETFDEIVCDAPPC